MEFRVKVAFLFSWKVPVVPVVVVPVVPIVMLVTLVVEKLTSSKILEEMTIDKRELQLEEDIAVILSLRRHIMLGWYRWKY